jgi:hypothetical protein
MIIRLNFWIAFMLGLGVNSFISGAFQYKHYLRVQLVPHISRHHQVCTIFDNISHLQGVLCHTLT